MSTAVIIVAAGRGSRAGGGKSGLPKQYRSIGGVAVIRRSVAAFAGRDIIGTILPVIHSDDRSLYEAAIDPALEKLADPVMGGATRQESVRAGLEALVEHPPRNVLIHDAARPFLSGVVIDRVVGELDKSAGAIPALPISDTLKRESGGLVVGTLDREGLWAAQTPQGFHFDAILAAHRAAAAEGRADFTDDAAIAEWHGLEVALVNGDKANVKLTTVEDFELAEKRLSAGETRIGQGFDVHAFTEGDAVVLCGVKIPHAKALGGHSDADVGLHALTDALLGAIGEGDIGTHFPPTDPQWRGASSDIFLSDAVRRVASRGGRIVNVDVTLICEAPKIGPHAEGMRRRVAEILGISAERVAIKATTTEKLGFTGRGEGIAAMATANVQLP